MTTIYTRIIPATNTKGTRVVAKCDQKSVTIPYPYEMSGEEVHRAAGVTLATMLGVTLAEKSHAATPAGLIFNAQ